MQQDLYSPELHQNKDIPNLCRRMEDNPPFGGKYRTYLLCEHL